MEQAQAEWMPVVTNESLPMVRLCANSGFRRLRKEEYKHFFEERGKADWQMGWEPESNRATNAGLDGP